MSVTESAPQSKVTLLQRFRRPTEVTESTRWLMAGLAVLSIPTTLPYPLSSATLPSAILLIIGSMMLAASCAYVYLTKHVPIGMDLLDIGSLTVFMLGCPDPSFGFAIIFGSIWFRGLYGSSARRFLRCGFAVVAVASALLLRGLNPQHTTAADFGVVGGVTFTLFLTAIVVGRLKSGLVAQEQALRRDAALAITGSKLLSSRDSTSIRAISYAAAVEICSATPGLRLLMTISDGDELRVIGATGGFHEMPVTFARRTIAAPPDLSDPAVLDPAALNASVGTPLEWLCINMGGSLSGPWVFIGAPVRVPAAAVLAVRSLANQTILAFRNSDVHLELTAQARVDSLTGLANRSSFTSELTAVLAANIQVPAAHVLFLDLDDFKDVNDILGHRAGDELLIDVASKLRRFTRPDDTCARLGGDEFAVILRGATDLDASRIARRIVDSIGQPILLGGRTARVGASVGIACGTPGITVEELVHQADVAMYAAKANGKGRAQFFDADLLQADSTRLNLESELSAGILAEEFVVHYQPVLSLPDLACVAVEALMRWQHPTRGLLPPRDFIEAAEHTGAIVEIGAFVMRRACADLLIWRASYPHLALAVHVNVAAKQLNEDHFVDTVTSCLSDAQLPASALVLELTETVVLNSPEAIKRLQTLSKLGVQIAIDDFGTGYSSLTTLRALPINVIKLDASFTTGALANSIDRTVVAAVVDMTAKLGLRTIAEGVERPEQQHLLADIGADAVQGYLYQRPVAAAQLTDWLEIRQNVATATANSSVTVLRPRPRIA